MKSFIFITALLSIAGISNAALTETGNKKRLDTLWNNRTGTVWTCATNTHAQAVVMFQVSHKVSHMISGTTPLAIVDKKVCQALNVICPYVANATIYGRHHFPNRKFVYWSTNGKYEDTVAFVSDGSGMKLVAISNGSQPTVLWNKHWHFDQGLCRFSKSN